MAEVTKSASETEPESHESFVCPGCKSEATGRFCSRCGEERGHHIYSVGHLFHEFVHTLTHADSSVFRTTLDLFRYPGELTRAYFWGPRRRYLGPVQFFFICNVIMFFACAAERIVPFSAPFDNQMQQQDYSRAIEARGLRFLSEAKNQDEEHELKTRYDEHTVHLSKSIVILQVPLFALLLTLTFVGSKRFFVEHLVFAFHFYSFFMLGLCLVGAFVIGLFVAGHALGLPMEGVLEKGLMLLLIGISIAWLYSGLRRYYGCGVVSASLRALVLGICTLPLMMLYRWFLFYATIWTL